MNIETRELQGVAVAVVSGEIDSKTAPEAQARLLPFVEEHKTILIDMNGLTFMSSAGLRMMLLIYRHATALSGKVAIVGLSEQIRDTMTATGFIDFFVVADTVDDALKSLKS